MSYIVNWASTGSGEPDAKPSISVADKTQDTTSTSLILTGKGLNDYGQIQQQNFIRLLENFAKETAPANPTVGQLWFSTADMVMYVYTDVGPYDGWEQLGGAGGGGTAAGLAEYGFTPDPGVTGLATRLNRILGTPTYTEFSGDYATAFGWGQTDLVPTYNEDGELDSASIAAQTNLPDDDVPDSQTFPPIFNNEAWAIFISRLRKAMRHVGLDESDTSPVGFINDNRPLDPGNVLANLYNDFGGQGTLADILKGWNGAGTSTVNGYFTATSDALDDLEAGRFGLDLSVPVEICSAERVNPPFATYEHVIEVRFAAGSAAASKLKAQAFFNAGGTLRFNWEFDATGATDAELGWAAFLLNFNDLAFDHRGMRLGTVYQSYNTQNDGDPYAFVTRGFYSIVDYDNSGDPLPLFSRDAEDYGESGAYLTFPNGGLNVTAWSDTVGNEYVITFTIEYIIGEFDGDDDPNNILDGTFYSRMVAGLPSTNNLNEPIFTAREAGVAYVDEDIQVTVDEGTGSFVP